MPLGMKMRAGWSRPRVVLTHVCETLRWFPWLAGIRGWAQHSSLAVRSLAA
jgi:hypothetical protein